MIINELQPPEDHPANVLSFALHDLDEQSQSSEAWWSGYLSLLAGAEEYTGTRSIDSAMYGMAVKLLARGEVYLEDKDRAEEIFREQVIPVWERELEKRDDDSWLKPWRVFQYASLVGGERSRAKVEATATSFKSLLPQYEDLPSYFPSTFPSSLMAAAHDQLGSYLKKSNNMFLFCEVGRDVQYLLALCQENNWTSEVEAWSEIQDYFDNLLLHVDFNRVDSRMIDSMLRYVRRHVKKEDLVKQIETRVSGYKRMVRLAHLSLGYFVDEEIEM